MTQKLLEVLIFGYIISVFTFAMDDWRTWDTEKLEKEMSPSSWNPTKAPDEVIREYVDISIQETLKAQRIPHELNIPYGSASSQQYDIYGTDLPETSPIFIWIHGGFWQEGSKDISGILASNLHSKGVRNAVLGYTLAPKATLKDIEYEILSAIQNITHRYPNSKLTIGGHSAGAQLAAMLLHSTNGFPELYQQVEGLVLVSGIYDLRLLVPTYVNTALKLTRSDAERSSPLRIRGINAEFQKKSSDFKILVTVGVNDSPEFQRQSKEYYNFLKKTFPNAKFWKSSSDDHFTLVHNMGNASFESGKEFSEFASTLSGASSTIDSGSSSTVLMMATKLITILAAINLIFA